MGFNSGFKGLKIIVFLCKIFSGQRLFHLRSYSLSFPEAIPYPCTATIQSLATLCYSMREPSVSHSMYHM